MEQAISLSKTKGLWNDSVLAENCQKLTKLEQFDAKLFVKLASNIDSLRFLKKISIPAKLATVVIQEIISCGINSFQILHRLQSTPDVARAMIQDFIAISQLPNHKQYICYQTIFKQIDLVFDAFEQQVMKQPTAFMSFITKGLLLNFAVVTSNIEIIQQLFIQFLQQSLQSGLVDNISDNAFFLTNKQILLVLIQNIITGSCQIKHFSNTIPQIQTLLVLGVRFASNSQVNILPKMDQSIALLKNATINQLWTVLKTLAVQQSALYQNQQLVENNGFKTSTLQFLDDPMYQRNLTDLYVNESSHKMLEYFVCMIDFSSIQVTNYDRFIQLLEKDKGKHTKQFLQKLINLIANQESYRKIVSLSQVEIAIVQAQDNVLIQIENIGEELKITKNIDLKGEQQIKKRNQERLQLIDKLKSEEQSLRDFIISSCKHLIMLLTFVKNNVRSVKDIQYFAPQVLEVLVQVSHVLPLSSGQFGHIFNICNMFMGYYQKHSVVSASLASPNYLVFIMKYIFNENGVIKLIKQNIEQFRLNSMYQEYSFVNQNKIQYDLSLEQIFEIETKNWLSSSYIFNASSVLPYFIHAKTIPPAIQKQFVQLLFKQLKVLHGQKIPNSLDNKSVIRTLFKFQYCGFEHSKLVELLIFNASINKQEIDEDFINPIIQALINTNIQMRDIAISVLGILPHRKQLVTSRLQQAYLFLSESYSDTVMRFFMAAGGRQQFLLKPVEVSEYLCDICFKEENKSLADSLPNALRLLCEEMSEKQFVTNLVGSLLNKHLSLQEKLEDTLFDVDSHQSFCRLVIWKSINAITKSVVAFDKKISQDWKQGLMMYPISKQIPLQCNVPVQDQADLIDKRLRLLNEPFDSQQYKIVSSAANEEVYFDFLKNSENALLEVDPTKTQLSLLILERFLVYGIFDFDDSTVDAACDAIKSLIREFGEEFNKRITYAYETNRVDTLQSIQIASVIPQMANRLLLFSANVLDIGIIHKYTISEGQLKNVNVDALAKILSIIAEIAAQISWEDPLRGQIIDFVEELSGIKDMRFNSTLYSAINQSWKSILKGQFIKTPKNQKYPHQQYQSSTDFAKTYLIPRYQDTILKNSSDFPGCGVCLTGVVCAMGLSWVNTSYHLLSNVVCKCIQQEENLQWVGLTMIKQLLIYFKQLLEPYVVIYMKDIMFLCASESKLIVDFANDVMIQQIKSLSQLGIQYLIPTLQNAMDADSSWELVKGGCDFVYQVCCNAAKLSQQLFRQMLTKFLPALLPSLQQHLYHLHFRVKQAATLAIQKVAESVQSSSFRAMANQIIEAYHRPEQNRNLLLDISELTFQQQLDAGSLNLIFPIVDRVLNQNSSVIYFTGNERMRNVHIKVIAANCLILFSQITKQQDLCFFINRIKQLLINNINETNMDIRKACCVALSTVLNSNRQLSLQTEYELKQRIFSSPHHVVEANGLSQAVVYISYSNDTWRQLVNEVSYMLFREYNYKHSYIVTKCTCGSSCKLFLIQQQAVCENCGKTVEEPAMDWNYSSSDKLSIALYLLYLPQRIIELNDVQAQQEFTTQFLELSLDLAFQLVSIKDITTDNYSAIQNLGRQLVTSFLSQEINCRIVGKSINNSLISDNVATRLFTTSVVGDLISELGSTVLAKENSRALKEEVKQMRDQYVQVTLNNEEKQVQKVFIPEPAIQNAIRMLTQEVYDKMMMNLFILRSDDEQSIRIAAIGMWKLVTLKPIHTIMGFIPFIPNYLTDLMLKANSNYFEQFDANGVAFRVIGELVFNLSEEQFEPLIDYMVKSIQQFSNDEVRILPILDMLSAVAKADKTGELISKEVLLQIPSLIANCKSMKVSTAASNILSNIQTDVSSLINSIVSPMLADLETMTDMNSVKQLAHGLFSVTGSKLTLIKQILELLIGPQVKSVKMNSAWFIVEYVQLSQTLQENIELVIEPCFSRMSKESCLLTNQSNQLLQSKTMDVMRIHPMVYIINGLSKISYIEQSDYAEMIEILVQYTTTNLLSQLMQVSAPSILSASTLLQNQPIDLIQQKTLFIGFLFALFNQTINEDFEGIFAFSILAVKNMYQQLKNTDLKQDFVQILVQQLLSIANSNAQAKIMPVLCKQVDILNELFIIIAEVQQDQQIQPKIREDALQAALLFTMSVLHSYTQFNKVDSFILEVEDFRFEIPKQEAQQNMSERIVTTIVGRIIQASIPPSIADQMRFKFVRYINFMLQVCPKLHLFEIAIRSEAERKCLLSGDKKLQLLGGQVLINLCKISLRKEQSLMALLNVIFANEGGVITGVQEKLTEALGIKVLEIFEKCVEITNLGDVKFIAKPKEIKPQFSNLYKTVIVSFVEHLMLEEHDQLLLPGGAVIARSFQKLFLLDQELFQQLANEYLLCQNTGFKVAIQLIIFRQLLMICQNQSQIYQHLNINNNLVPLFNHIIQQKDMTYDVELLFVLGLFITLLKGDDRKILQQYLLIYTTIVQKELLPAFDQLSKQNQMIFLESLIAFDQFAGDFELNPSAPNLATIVGSVTLGFHQKCLNCSDMDVGQLAQQTLITFYRLRFGKDVWSSVQNVIKLKQASLSEDMDYRVNTIVKLIKQGKI